MCLHIYANIVFFLWSRFKALQSQYLADAQPSSSSAVQTSPDEFAIEAHYTQLVYKGRKMIEQEKLEVRTDKMCARQNLTEIQLMIGCIA